MFTPGSSFRCFGSAFHRLIFAAITALFSLSPAFGETAARPAEPASAPAPSVEQRLASLEAYFANSDPTSALKNPRGETPAGLRTPTSAVAGPGHNAWLMVSAALVFFMTLPGLALFYGGLVRAWESRAW